MKDKNILRTIDKAWTLFLDRDGVLNKKMGTGDYVKSMGEMELLPGVCDALKLLSETFSTLVVVTNQRGISRGIVAEKGLHDIHEHLMSHIRKNKGRVDKIYFCPHGVGACDCRKPDLGMAYQAKKDFPDIDFKKSIMVGDSVSDMEFGKKAGMVTVFITQTTDVPDSADFAFRSLYEFCQQFQW